MEKVRTYRKKKEKRQCSEGDTFQEYKLANEGLGKKTIESEDMGGGEERAI